MVEYVYSTIGNCRPSPGAVGFGTYDERKGILGGAVFDHYAGNSLFMHVASTNPRWITRSLLWAVFDYPFNQAKVGRVNGLTPANNADAVKFNLNVGFKEEGRIPDAVAPGVDLIVFGMYKEDCRFLDNPKYQLDPRHLDPDLLAGAA